MIRDKDIPEDWMEVKLGEISTIKGRIGWKGLKSSEYVKDGYPILTSYNLINANEGIDYSIKINRVPKWRYDESPDIRVQNKDILMSKIEGRVGYVQKLPEESTVNSTITIIRIKNEGVNSKFIYYFLKSHNFRRFFLKNLKGTTMRSINHASLKKTPILLPSHEIQSKIVSILEKAEQLKQWRKKSDKLTDDYLNSVFLEIFGDPIRNPKHWNLKRINDILIDIEAGWSIKGEERVRMNGEFGVLKVSSVTYGVFLPNEYKVIDKNFKIKKVVSPEKGDILFSRANTRELVGATCLIKEDYPFLILPDKLWKIKLDKEQVCAEYLKFILSHPSTRAEISSQSTGTSGSMLNISMTKFKRICIILPPIDLQIKFAAVVRQLEEIKEIQNQSKQHIDDLFNILMQKSFRGELVC